MGRCDNARTPFASNDLGDFIPAISYDGPHVDMESPMSTPEVGRFTAMKSDQMKRGPAIDFNPETGELKYLAFFSQVSIAMLAEALKVARQEGKIVKSMSLLIDVESGKESRFALAQANFHRDESRDQPLYWTYVNPLVKPKRAPKPPVVTEPEPEPELKSIGLDEYQQKQKDLEQLRARIQTLRDEHASEGIS
jgi:hypothetical protein